MTLEFFLGNSILHLLLTLKKFQFYAPPLKPKTKLTNKISNVILTKLSNLILPKISYVILTKKTKTYYKLKYILF